MATEKGGKILSKLFLGNKQVFFTTDYTDEHRFLYRFFIRLAVLNRLTGGSHDFHYDIEKARKLIYEIKTVFVYHRLRR